MGEEDDIAPAPEGLAAGLEEGLDDNRAVIPDALAAAAALSALALTSASADIRAEVAFSTLETTRSLLATRVAALEALLMLRRWMLSREDCRSAMASLTAPATSERRPALTAPEDA